MIENEALTGRTSDSTPESPSPPTGGRSWLRLFAGVILLFIIGMGGLMVLNGYLPEREPVRPDERVVDNPNITGRFVSELKQTKVRLDEVQTEMAQLKEHRSRLREAVEEYRQDDNNLPPLLATLVADVEQRLNYLMAEKNRLEEQIASLQNGR